VMLGCLPFSPAGVLRRALHTPGDQLLPGTPSCRRFVLILCLIIGRGKGNRLRSWGSSVCPSPPSPASLAGVSSIYESVDLPKCELSQWDGRRFSATRRLFVCPTRLPPAAAKRPPSRSPYPASLLFLHRGRETRFARVSSKPPLLMHNPPQERPCPHV